ncbi:MAG: polysaccharide biosynthesis tyrosine autokinase [Acidimicrobiales bacterium]
MQPELGPEEAELDLRAYVHILRRRWRWVAGATLVTILLALGYSFQQSPKYRASSQLLIRTLPTESLVSGDEGRPITAQDAERQLNNEIEILESGAMRDAAREGYDGPLDVESVSGSVSSDRSDVVRVSATGGDPDEVADLVNTYVGAFIEFRRSQRVEDITSVGAEIQTQIDRLQQQIDEIRVPLAEIDAQLDEDPSDALVAQREDLLAQIEGRTAPLVNQQAFYRQQFEDLNLTRELAGGQASGAQVLTEATAPTSPVSPQPARNAVLAAVLGLLIGVGLAFLRDYFDESIRTSEDLERLADGQLPTLGVIPVVGDDSEEELGGVVTEDEPTSIAAEAYRALRTAVRFAGLDRSMKVIQVTSSTTGEGKTTTVANLATALAQAGQRVAVVCCDLRRPRIHEMFGRTMGPGFTDVLLGETPLNQALRRQSNYLYLLPAGSRPPNPSELLGTSRAEAVINALAAEFDYVVIDSTPILPVTDGIVVSRFVHATLFVANARRTTRNHVRQALSLLRQADAPTLGFVLNRVPTGRGRYGYAYTYAYATAYASDDGNAGRKGRRARRHERERDSVTTDA